MVRYPVFLVLASCALAPLQAQEPTAPPPPPPGPPPHHAHEEPGAPGKLPPKVRDRMKNLPPEEREKFLHNFKKWESMSEEERQAMRERMQSHRQQIRAGFEAFLDKLGVTEEDERKAIAKRYFEERRKVEAQIRQEMDERRKELIQEMETKLAQELKPGN